MKVTELREHSQGNLDAYRASRKSLNHEEKRSFDAYFIGALAVLASAKEWLEAVESAERCIASDRQRHAEKVRA